MKDSQLGILCTGGEMVDTLVLGTSPARGGGSSPLPCTNKSAKADFLMHGKQAKVFACVRTRNPIELFSEAKRTEKTNRDTGRVTTEFLSR